MRKLPLLAFRRVALAALVLSMAGSQAWSQTGNNRDFRLVNNTRHDVVSIWFSTPRLDTWIRSNRGWAGSGGSADVVFDNVGPCLLQLRLEFSNGGVAEWLQGFDLCSIGTITVTYNSASRKYNARSD